MDDIDDKDYYLSPEVIKELGELRELIKEDMATWPKNQVLHDWEHQIMWKHQLEVGQIYFRKSLYISCSIKLKVLSLSYKHELGGLIIDCEYENRHSESGWYKDHIFLSDLGIVPYDDGTWNPYNYLVKQKDCKNDANTGQTSSNA